MEVISIRVPKELKEEMRRLDINWAEYIRNLIEEKVRRACQNIDKIREKTIGVKFDSVSAIREDRDSR